MCKINEPRRSEEHEGRKEEERKEITRLLNQSTDELTNLLRGLNGEFIPPAPGGDLLRDGAGVLPTGRNIHALDPYRMPSPAAFERGKEIAKKIISQSLDENKKYPETVAVLLWGLDAIKTKGSAEISIINHICRFLTKRKTRSGSFLLSCHGHDPVVENNGR